MEEELTSLCPYSFSFKGTPPQEKPGSAITMSSEIVTSLCNVLGQRISSLTTVWSNWHNSWWRCHKYIIIKLSCFRARWLFNLGVINIRGMYFPINSHRIRQHVLMLEDSIYISTNYIYCIRMLDLSLRIKEYNYWLLMYHVNQKPAEKLFFSPLSEHMCNIYNEPKEGTESVRACFPNVEFDINAWKQA